MTPSRAADAGSPPARLVPPRRRERVGPAPAPTRPVRASETQAGARRPAGRTLAGYLLMPRPGDAFKALLIPCTFLLGVLGTGGTDLTTVLRAVVVLFAVEFLIYPARYQWNDVRGFAADQRHPGAVDRGRLPGPVERGREHILASCAVAGLRLALVAVLVLALPGLRLGPLLGLAVVAVFGVAAVYEALRQACTGRSEQVPAPMRPTLVGLWIAVGAGYAVRGLIGLGLAVDLVQRPALAVTAAVALWAYGIAFVTSRWAVEATAFCTVRSGRPEWAVEAQHAREHLMALVRWLPDRVASQPGAPATMPGADWTPLRGRTSVLAPWNLGFVVSGGAAALTGWWLAAPAADGVGPRLAVAAGGALLTLAVLLVPSGARWALTALGAAVLLVQALLLGAGTGAWASVLPWAAVMVAYATATRNSLSTMGSWTTPLTRPCGTAAGAVARWVVGPSAWELIRSRTDVDHEPAAVAGPRGRR